MAKYIVVSSCGCSTEVEIFGSTKDRMRKIEYLQTTPCGKCRPKRLVVDFIALMNKNTALALRGDTYPLREKLKANGWYWDAVNLAWVFPCRKEDVKDSVEVLKDLFNEDASVEIRQSKVVDEVTQKSRVREGLYE